ncbi:MAG: sugar phosphate isomerase/epimerase family protein [Candidatus Acidiferrales bacterium]
MSMGVALAAKSVGGAQFPGAAPAAAEPPRAAGANPMKIDAYSRHLQWLRTPDEVAQAVIDMGFDGLDITVRSYPGHVDPTRVAQDLPPFVNTVRKHGILVRTITCPIADADSPNAEQILATAASLGITHYWWGTFRYDTNQPVMPQLDALKPRVEKLARLNEKYKMKAMYHTYEGDRTVGAAIWDFLYVLRNFDPAYVSFHYDVGHMVVAGGGNTWALNLRAAGPYVGGVSAKDYTIELDLGLSGGGPYAGQPLGGFGAPGGRGRGGPGAPGGAAAEGPGAAPERGRGAAPERGRGAGAPEAAPNAPQGRGARTANAAPGEPAAGGRGAGRGGRGGAFAGRGGAVPSRGGGGMPNPYRVKAVPLGDGLANLPELGSILKEINFSGPVEIQAEYPNGGAESAQDKITLPREMILGAMKRDRLVLKAAFEQDGLT